MIYSADSPFTPEDDCYHQLSDDPYETETNWWSFNIPERKIGCWFHAPYFPNRKTVTWRVFVWDDAGALPTQLAYYKRVDEAAMPDRPDLRNLTFPEGGFSLKMIEPLMKYQLAYHDIERNFALNFTFTGAHHPRRFPPGNPPFMDNPHLDQLGFIEGVLILRGEEIPIRSWSVRDRTWGPRGGPHASSRKVYASDAERIRHPGGPRWRQIERERGRGRIQYVFGHADANTGFLGFVRVQDGDASGWAPMNAGYILRDGVYAPLDGEKSKLLNIRDPKTGWTQHIEVRAIDQSGRAFVAEGDAVSRMSEAGHGANTLMRWEFDDRIGWGEDQDVWQQAHFLRMLDALRSTR